MKGITSLNNKHLHALCSKCAKLLIINIIYQLDKYIHLEKLQKKPCASKTREKNNSELILQLQRAKRKKKKT